MTQRCESDDLPGVATHDVTAHRRLAAKNDTESREGAPTSTLGSPMHPYDIAPQWMSAALARLESRFPAFSFTIIRGWRGFSFEAWRDPAPSGLYAVITDDPRELWHELETVQR